MSAALWISIHSGRIKCCVFVGSVDLVLVGSLEVFTPLCKSQVSVQWFQWRVGLIKAQQWWQRSGTGTHCSENPLVQEHWEGHGRLSSGAFQSRKGFEGEWERALKRNFTDLIAFPPWPCRGRKLFLKVFFFSFCFSRKPFYKNEICGVIALDFWALSGFILQFLIGGWLLIIVWKRMEARQNKIRIVLHVL